MMSRIQENEGKEIMDSGIREDEELVTLKRRARNFERLLELNAHYEPFKHLVSEKIKELERIVSRHESIQECKKKRDLLRYEEELDKLTIFYKALKAAELFEGGEINKGRATLATMFACLEKI